MAKSPQQVGKEFEEHLQSALKLMQKKMKFTFSRMYDSHSSGGFLPAQPGDFCGVANGRGWLMEAKSSAKVDSLHLNKSVLSDNMSSTQSAFMKIWHRAGALTVVPFLSQETGVVEFWDGYYLATIYSQPRVRPINEDGLILTCGNWHTETLYTAMTEILMKG